MSEGTDGPKLLECFVDEGDDFRMRPAPPKRAWMDATPERFAYRCLPLAVANTHGWDILNKAPFQARWNGNEDVSAITMATLDGKPHADASSHFGSGVLTFHVGCLFKTPPGYDLWVCGPTNQLKDGIQALTALVETDWSPYTFTMNWKFTRRNHVVEFLENEPIATVFPIKRRVIETFEPVRRTPSDDPELWAQFSEWRASRTTFNKDLQVEGSDAQSAKWQKDYMTGPEQSLDPPHRSKLRLQDFPKTRPAHDHKVKEN